MVRFMESAAKQILESFRHIAIVGLSARPDRPSNFVARYMMDQGYTIYPVNPGLHEVFGITCHASLLSMPKEVQKKIEIVNIFRNPADVPPIIDESIAIGAKAIWMQLGIANETAAEKARNAGLLVVENRCIAVEHRQLFG
jgi:hypothetical protein